MSTTQSTTNASTGPRDFTGTLYYNASLPGTRAGEKWFLDINDESRKNFEKQPHQCQIHDLRGQEQLASLETTGFQTVHSPSTVSADLLLHGSEEEIQRVYYPEVESLLKSVTGADRVVFFDHTVRKTRTDVPDNHPSQRQPVQQVHVDQTPTSALKRVDRHVSTPVPYKRVQLINVWRPIENTVYDWPLAVADFRSLNLGTDLVPTRLEYPRPLPDGETYSVQYNPNHKWYYWSRMSTQEVLLLKCYDSSSKQLSVIPIDYAQLHSPLPTGDLMDVAALAPHTAVYDSELAKTGIKRQSIEVRALVFHDK